MRESRGRRFGQQWIGAAAAIVAVAAFVVGSAAAQEDGEAPANEPTAQLNPTEGPPGTVVVVSGTCPTSVAVVFSFDGNVEIPVADDGSFAGSIVVPADASPGARGIRTACRSGDALSSPSVLTFTVTDAAPVAPPDSSATAMASVTSGPPGSAIAVTGECTWDVDEPGERVHIELQAGANQGNPSPVALAAAGAVPVADGSYSASLVVPAGLGPGVYRLSVQCLARGAFAQALSADFTVTAAAPPTTPPTAGGGDTGGTTLPATG